MTLALWIFSAWFVLIFGGTWLIQIAVWTAVVLVRIGWLALKGATILIVGLAGFIILAVVDRAELKRVWDASRPRRPPSPDLGLPVTISRGISPAYAPRSPPSWPAAR